MFWRRKSKQPLSIAPEPAPTETAATGPEPMASLVSDVGCHRELNEDSGRIVHAGPGRGLLVIVADGMGGHQAGEVASQTAVETIGEEYRIGEGTPGEALAAAFRKAHQRIFDLGHADRSMSGMGTTCTALAINGDEAWAAHVGDSRLYLVRDGSIYQLSEDHTQCMEMVRRGLMTMEEAHQHEDRNVLTHAMGTRPQLHAMFFDAPMKVLPGDKYLLCSDGLHDLVPESDMQDVLRFNGSEPACRKLVTMAKGRGGFDNVTAAVVSIPGGDAAALKETRDIEVKE